MGSRCRQVARCCRGSDRAGTAARGCGPTLGTGSWWHPHTLVPQGFCTGVQVLPTAGSPDLAYLWRFSGAGCPVEDRVAGMVWGMGGGRVGRRSTLVPFAPHVFRREPAKARACLGAADLSAGTVPPGHLWVPRIWPGKEPLSLGADPSSLCALVVHPEPYSFNH